MKCILIDPPIMMVNISKREGIKEAKEQAQNYPPIGLTYIAAVLRENGVEVKIIDAKSLAISPIEVSKAVEKENPDIVGVTVFTVQVKSALETCKEIKKVCPNTKIVLGGPHISPMHEHIIKSELVDFCVRGEGEITMLELMKAISNGTDLKDVKGITFKDDSNIVVTPDRPFIKDLDTLPFPARDLLPNHIYKGRIQSGEFLNFTQITASRGCPFKCDFCSVPQYWHIHRRRSVENVLDEIEHVYKIYKINYIRFTDEVFALNKKWVINFCKGLIERGLNEKIPWSCDARVDLVSQEMLREMKKANCHFISYGIEFGNQRILNFSRKGTTIAQIHEAIRMTKKAGIPVYGLFMLGYPTETNETIEDTIALAANPNIDNAGFSVVTPFPGTRLYDYCKENNLLRTENWEEYNIQQPGSGVIKLKNVADEELIELYSRAHHEFFFRHVRDRLREDLFDLLSLQEKEVR